MSDQPIFVTDTNVFITAHDDYYAFDICPGFWEAVINHHAQGSIRSIDKVEKELLYEDEDPFQPKGDKLIEWVVKSLSSGFFRDSEGDSEVTNNYESIVEWAERHPQYHRAAAANFAGTADSWLIAYAMTHGAVVVTNEVSAPQSEKKIKIPDVCSAFGVECMNTFQMLRALKVQFILPQPKRPPR